MFGNQRMFIDLLSVAETPLFARLLASAFVLSCVVQAGTGNAVAAEGSGYPTKPVRLIVAVPPGSGADTITRGVAQRLSGRWGVNVIVDNRPGAGGVIAMDIAKDATPDGYTLLSASPGLVSTATLLKKVTECYVNT